MMGTWALEQAKALVRQGVELLVVSFTSAVPRLLALTPGAKAYASCPLEYLWPGDVQVLYPRWLYYPIEPIKSWMYSNPQPYLKLAGRTACDRLAAIIESFSPDLLFCHHSLPNGWLAAQQVKRFDVPMVSFDHDYGEISDCRQYQYRRQAMQPVVDSAWAMLSVSERMRQDLQAIFPAARRTATHTIGVDLPLKQHLESAKPLELKDKTIILCCALFTERKGIVPLVQAFCTIAQKHPDAVLRIIGGGDEEDNIKAAISRYDSAQQVSLLGKKPHAEVLQEMCWADCFALASWDEPLGAVYLEAMAAGKPIVCCNDGGINEIVTSGVHGYAISPRNVSAIADALDKLLSHPEQRIAMGRSAQQLIEQEVTWDARAKELVSLFNEAINAPFSLSASAR